MSATPPHEPATLPLALAWRMDEVCSRFEAAWRAASSPDRRPRIQDYLADMPEPGCSELLRELIRVDIFHRRRSAEDPQPADYHVRFPALDLQWLAGALAARPAEGAVPASVVGPPAGPPDPAVDRGPVPRQLGEYRILREVGRGGMGVVYEAVQESLGRHVALKVLPSHGLLSPTHRERFRREAQAAARLHHTNIVPVFDCGEGEDVHYYAMQFIQGQGLDAVLQEVRRLRRKGAPPAGPAASGAGPSRGIAQGLLTGRFPGPEGGTQPAAGPGLPPAPAPGHSGSGSGLTAQPEAQYFRSVARMGVQVAEALEYAHQQGVLHRDIKPSNLLLDARGTVWVSDFGLAKAEGAEELTQTGDVVGTLAYMAPERFQGRSYPRSDVYGLGVTLYELLTLRPAFADANRVRLIERVRHEDAPRPRKLDPRIPRDLETICLKCLAKEPHQRYATAGALADDLRRFLAGEPIRARPVGRVERLWRWCRRKPLVAGLTAALIVVWVTGQAGVLWQWRRAEREKERADTKAADAEANAGQAQAQEAKAKRAGERAEAYLAKALQAVDEMLTEVADRNLAQVPGMERKRRQLLQRALAFYDSFREDKSDDPLLRQKTGQAYGRAGAIHSWLGDDALAEKAFGQAVAIQQQLVDDFPDEPAYRYDLATTFYSRVRLLRDARQLPEALQVCRQARAHYRQLADAVPAEPLYRNGLARSYHSLGNLLQDMQGAGWRQQAEAAYRSALKLQEELVANFPRPTYRLNLAQHLHSLAHLIRADRPDEAREAFRRALELLEKLADEDPEVHRYRHELARAYHNWGNLLRDTGRLDATVEAYRKAVQLHTKLAADFPYVLAYRHELGRNHHNLGHVLVQTQRPREAETAFREALKLQEPLASDFPSRAAFQRNLGVTLNKLASLRLAGGEPAQARDFLRRAIPHLQAAVDLAPANADYQKWLRSSSTDLVRLEEKAKLESK